MKKVYLVHGWGGSSTSEAWFDWLREELDNLNTELVIFDMPNSETPRINEWMGFLKENVKNLNEETFFIGHSIGCQAVLRYLETLDSNIKIGGAVFVAPWMELDMNTIEEEGPESVEISKPWMETPINFDNVKEHTHKFLCILSDDDPYVPLSNEEFFKEKLGAKTFVKHEEEHFNETKKIPEIIDFLK
jgi:predicted alpha/beta hydrolase family esterase